MSPQKRKKAYRHLREVKPSGPHKREWLHWWVKTYFGIHIPNVKVCHDHDAPFTAFADAFFNESSKGCVDTAFVCHGSRLFGGKTFLQGLLACCRMILLGAECYILGGSKDQTAVMRRYLFQNSPRTNGIWWDAKRAPKHLWQKGGPTTDTLKLTNGGEVTALAASQKETRGKHGTDLYGDEVDEMEWEVLSSAFGQTVKRDDIAPLTFLASTWQHPDGTLTQLFDHAEEKNWGVYTWCWRETHASVGGHISDEDLDDKRAEMTELDWITEVELQRPAAGDLIFEPEIVEVLFDAGLGKFEDIVGHDYLLIPPELGDYYTGADWAKQRDFTVISTFLESATGPDRLAAFCMRQKEPWPVMLNYINTRINDYGGPCHYDGTGMAGDMIEDNILVEATPFEFSRVKEMHQMYSSFITACESGEYVLPPIPHLKKVFSLLTRGQVYESSRVNKKNHTPDAFASMALARRAKTEDVFELMLGRV